MNTSFRWENFKEGISNKWYGCCLKPFTPYMKVLIVTNQQQTAFENIVSKGEISHNEQFLLFSQRVLLKQIYRICHELTVEIKFY